MSSKKRKMLFCYYLPGIIGLIRIITTLVFFIWNPVGLALRYFQILLLISYAVHLFCYFKLYDDGIPIITIIAPSIIHGVIIFIFVKQIPLLSLGILLGMDIVFLITKSIKASYFPFDIEGDEEEDLFEDADM